jgi:hypothetical protein
MTDARSCFWSEAEALFEHSLARRAAGEELEPEDLGAKHAARGRFTMIYDVRCLTIVDKHRRGRRRYAARVFVCDWE